MKKFLILLFLSISLMNAQDKEPTAWNFCWGYDNTTPRKFELDSFIQTSILTGFTWSGSLKMNNALMNNCRAGALYQQETTAVTTPLMLIHTPTWGDYGCAFPGTINSIFMQYEPTLPLAQDLSNIGTILRPNDPSDPVFGFRYIGVAVPTVQDSNYSRLQVLKGDTVYLVNDTLLKGIWPQPQFQTYELNFGKVWYLTINLHRNETDPVMDDECVLSITIPYSGNGISGNIKFNKLPYNNKDSSYTLNYFENRGIAQKIHDSSGYDFKITRNMLPANQNNITISAEFITNDSLINYNPKFTQINAPSQISDIDIVVKYFGKLDIAIDYIRIESINANALLRGEVDSLGSIITFKTYHTNPDVPSSIDSFYTVKDVIQSCIDALRTKTNTWQDAKLFRFMYGGLESDKYYWWGSIRYYNKLTNGMFTTRCYPSFPNLYEYYSKANRWDVLGSFRGDDLLMTAPYFRHGNDNYTTMSLKLGFLGLGSAIYYPDSLKSDYETRISSWDTLLQDASYYWNTFMKNDAGVVQNNWEERIFECFWNPSIQNYKLLYSERPWWTYFLFYNVRLRIDTTFQGGQYTYDSNMIYSSYRPRTGEEMRLLIMTNLLKGCKGLIYDGDENQLLPNSPEGQMGLGNNNLVNSPSDLYSDDVGTDFIGQTHNTWNAYNYINLTNVASNMQIDSNRIYIGTKSLRTELSKIHEWIRANDETLMKLRLCAWYGKGYRTWGHQDTTTYGSTNILSQYLIPDSTKTRPIGRTNYGLPFYEQDSKINNIPIDSGFYDITLFRDTTRSMDTVFMIGIQNRRTDPLIQNNDEGGEMQFYSTAEYDIFCQSNGNTINGNNEDSTWWRDKWWQRLGVREVVLKFNFVNPYDSGDYCLLRVRELGVGTSLDTAWYRQPPYYHLIDTVIGQDNPLAIFGFHFSS